MLVLLLVYVQVIRLITKFVDATQSCENEVISGSNTIDLLNFFCLEAFDQSNLLVNVYLCIYVEHFFNIVKFILKLNKSIGIQRLIYIMNIAMLRSQLIQVMLDLLLYNLLHGESIT